jgi:hypothetical protein
MRAVGPDTAHGREGSTDAPENGRDRIKEKGGFVGGNCVTIAVNVKKCCRSMLTLDCDHARSVFSPDSQKTVPHAACYYTTLGYTPTHEG